MPSPFHLNFSLSASYQMAVLFGLHLPVSILTVAARSRLMDLLMDINESPQIPPERRVDVSFENEGKHDKSDNASKPTKTLQKLLKEVPHQSFDATLEQFPETLDISIPRTLKSTLHLS